jgi:hypothetical protein
LAETGEPLAGPPGTKPGWMDTSPAPARPRPGPRRPRGTQIGRSKSASSRDPRPRAGTRSGPAQRSPAQRSAALPSASSAPRRPGLRSPNPRGVGGAWAWIPRHRPGAGRTGSAVSAGSGWSPLVSHTRSRNDGKQASGEGNRVWQYPLLAASPPRLSQRVYFVGYQHLSNPYIPILSPEEELGRGQSWSMGKRTGSLLIQSAAPRDLLGGEDEPAPPD